MPKHDGEYAPHAPVRAPEQPRPEEVRLPQIVTAQRHAPKPGRSRKRGQRGDSGPAIVWVEAGLEDHRRTGKPLPSDRQQSFADQLAAMHAGLQRAGVEVASFIQEIGALNWATANVPRVVCACLQVEPRDVLRNSPGVADMVRRYTAHGVPVLLVMLTADSPSPAEAEAVRLCKIVCNTERIMLCMDCSSSQLAVMELVAQSYAFIDGRLRRIATAANTAATEPKAEEQREAEPAYESDFHEPHPPEDPAPVHSRHKKGVAEPSKRNAFKAPRPLKGAMPFVGAAARIPAAPQDEVEKDYGPDAFDTGLGGAPCARCSLLEEKLLNAQRHSVAGVMEKRMEEMRQVKEDEIQILKARNTELTKSARAAGHSGANKQVIEHLEAELQKKREELEAKEKEMASAARKDKSGAVRAEKWKTTKAMVSLEMARQQLTKLKEGKAVQLKRIAALEAEVKSAAGGMDEQLMQVTLQLNDAEVRLGDAEAGLAGTEAALAVEKRTVSSLQSLQSKLREGEEPAAAEGTAAFTPEEYVEAIEDMEEGEVQAACEHRKIKLTDDAAGSFVVMRSILRQNFILESAGVKAPDPEREEPSAVDRQKAIEKVRAQQRAEAEAAAAAAAQTEEEERVAAAAAAKIAAKLGTEATGDDEEEDDEEELGQVKIGAGAAITGGMRIGLTAVCYIHKRARIHERGKIELWLTVHGCMLCVNPFWVSLSPQ